jgi:hypothetical protein
MQADVNGTSELMWDNRRQECALCLASPVSLQNDIKIITKIDPQSLSSWQRLFIYLFIVYCIYLK